MGGVARVRPLTSQTSTHGTSRSIDSLQQLVTHGFYRILSDGLASSHLRPVASLRSLSLPTIRTRRFGYKIDGTCFRSVYNDPTAAVPQMCTSLPVLVTELFRSSDHTAILPRLRTSRLDQKHLLDRCIDGTLYAGHFMPVELLAAEQGAWATLGSRRSSCLVADISGESNICLAQTQTRIDSAGRLSLLSLAIGMGR